MGRVGASADNAMTGSFFPLLQNNVLKRQRWHSRQESPRMRGSWFTGQLTIIVRTFLRKSRPGGVPWTLCTPMRFFLKASVTKSY